MYKKSISIGNFLLLMAIIFTLVGFGICSRSEASVTNNTRALQAGDNLTYDVSGQIHQIQYAGTTNMTLTPEMINGASVLAATSVSNYSYNGSNISGTSVQYYQQETATRDIALYGRKLGTDPIATVTTTPLPIIWPGNWEMGKTIYADYQFNDGSGDSAFYTVAGQETVTTPAGTFSTWKCVRNQGSDAGTIWFSPELGYFVKMESNIITYTLRSTNITR